MKITIYSVLAAWTIALATPAHATVYTPVQFKKALTLKIGNRQGMPASSVTATFFRIALSDKRNKKNAVAYTSIVVSTLKKLVKPPLRGRSVNLLTRALLQGYFKGRKFNLNDPLFSRSFALLLSSLPASQKTAAVSQLIYNSLKSFALKNGSTQQQVYDYYLSKGARYNIQDPPSS